MNSNVAQRLQRLARGRRINELTERVTALEDAVDENRRLNQRLADVIDVVTEVLIPAADRDDDRLREALGRLTWALEEGAPEV